MAFLDNSGDIILDAVLTDAGRQRMARGEFKIVKFAFGDEEINYELFNSNHPSGSAFSDLQIMQTPILEAFTNNTSLMKTKLISINRNNILYMPIFRLNDTLGDADGSKFKTTGKFTGYDGYYVLADQPTADVSTGDVTNIPVGVQYGHIAEDFDVVERYIAIDQGLETKGNPPINTDMPDDLIETAYLVRMDHRLLRLYGFDKINNNADSGRYVQKANSFVDDDAIATYYISGRDACVVGPRDGKSRSAFNSSESIKIANAKKKEMFDGPLGPRIRIAPKTSIQVQQSEALFNELGSVGTSALSIRGTDTLAAAAYKYIDTLINVVGVTSGYSIDIPIRIIKKIS